MVNWKVGLLLVPLCVGCQQMRLPTAPEPVMSATTIDVAPLHVANEPRRVDAAPSAPAPPIRVQPRLTVPAWQQDVLKKIVRGLTDEALRATRESPGAIVAFEIEAAGGGSVIVGELRDPRRPRSGAAAYFHYLILPGALSFPDKATLLSALETAVPYKAEVRLRTGEVTCCLTKPAIAVTGRFEGIYASH